MLHSFLLSFVCLKRLIENLRQTYEDEVEQLKGQRHDLHQHCKEVEKQYVRDLSLICVTQSFVTKHNIVVECSKTLQTLLQDNVRPIFSML